MFERLSAKKKSEHVVEQILAAIRRGAYKAGDKLPPEDEIAEMTGVSRPSVREALGALRLVGILETKVGDGTYIKNDRWVSTGDNIKEVESQLFSLLEQGENPFEALESRRALEAGIIQYAIERRTPEDLQEIEAALERIDIGIETKDYDGLLWADRDFHLAIAKATQNSVLERTLASLFGVMEHGLWPRMKKELLRASDRHLEETRRSHQAIYKCIKDTDKIRAVEAMEEHFYTIERLFK